MTKIWDVKQPKDNWERNFALLNYQMMWVRMLFEKKIEVKNG